MFSAPDGTYDDNDEVGVGSSEKFGEGAMVRSLSSRNLGGLSPSRIAHSINVVAGGESVAIIGKIASQGCVRCRSHVDLLTLRSRLLVSTGASRPRTPRFSSALRSQPSLSPHVNVCGLTARMMLATSAQPKFVGSMLKWWLATIFRVPEPSREAVPRRYLTELNLGLCCELLLAVMFCGCSAYGQREGCHSSMTIVQRPPRCTTREAVNCTHHSQ